MKLTSLKYYNVIVIFPDICMCYGSYSSPYPLSDCGGSIPPCTVGYEYIV